MGALLCGQRVVGALAEGAGCPSLSSKARQVFRSLLNAAEHVGKHHEGVAGWRACGGRGGIRAGSTDVADGGLLQPAVRQSSSIASFSLNDGLGIGDLLIDGRGAALFFGALGAVGEQPGLGLVALVGGQVFTSTSTAGAPREGVGDGQGHADDDELPVGQQPSQRRSHGQSFAVWPSPPHMQQ